MTTTMMLTMLLSQIIFFLLSTADEASTMVSLRASLSPSPPPSWSASDSYCTWSGVDCDSSSRVTSINLASKTLNGTLPPDLTSLSHLTSLSLQNNRFTGQIPLIANLPSLRRIHLDFNRFTSVPDAAFQNLSNLETLTLNHNPFLHSWRFPNVTGSPNLAVFEAINTKMGGFFPSMIWQANLQVLKLSKNQIRGTIWQEPLDYKFKLHTLWIDQQDPPGFSGSLDFLLSMTQIAQVWLDHNSFTGPIPDFSNCTHIFDLQFNDNQLTGVVPPSLTSLPNLLNISLQNNNIFGPYPNFSATANVGDTSGFCSDKPGVACDEQVITLLNAMFELGSPGTLMAAWRGKDACKWKFIGCNKDGNVTVVDLGGQHFEGYIPTSLGNLTALIDLHLNDNGFAGEIPLSFTKLPHLKLLDVSSNYLTGTIPQFRSSVRVNSSGNMLVQNENLFNSASSSIEEIQNTGSISLTHSGSKVGMKVKFLVPVCVVVVAVLVAVTISAMLWLRSKKRRHGDECEEDSAGELGGLLRRFSYEILKTVTGNFDSKRKLGSGGFGSVYEGSLDGNKVAVKRLDRLGQGKKEFVAEVKTLGSIHHVNLVKLIGFCDENAHRLLVYEHMSNGSLDKWIFQLKEKKGSSLLDWSTRKMIILQIAKGLAYLHEECQHRIAHLDIKPQNILLDQNFNAKVADFGLAKLIDKGESFVMTQLRGTRGYLAPEWLSRKITEKADVYSFGVVFLEVVYGRRNFGYYKYSEEDDQEEDEEEVDSGNGLLVHLVKRKADANQLVDLVKECYQEMDDSNGEEVEKMVKLAICCVHEDPTRRPSMSNVVKALEGQMDMMLMEFQSTCHRSNSIDSCFGGSSSRQGDLSSVPNSVLSGPR